MIGRLSRTSLPALPLLLGIGFGILVAISAATVWLVNETERDAALVAHTFEVRGTLDTLRRLLRRAESGERGYLLTGDTEDLEIYRTGVAETERALADLRSLTADNPDQQAELDALEPVLRSKLADMAEVIRRTESQDRDGILPLIRRGRALMDALGNRIEGMQRAEQQLLERRSAEFRSTSHRLLFVTLAGALLIIALAAVSIVQTRRSTRALQEAHRAIEAANAGLEAIVAERTAELRESNEEIQRFAYIVSHDLRSPLVNIMGFTSELEALRDEALARLKRLRAAASPGDDQGDETLAEDFGEALGFIKTSIAKMDRLIQAILGLSRQGRREFTPEPVDMTALLNGIAASLAHQAEAAGATIRIEPLPEVTSDRLALEQIFSNLLDNALKYLRGDEPGRIEVRGRAAGGRVLYEVRDNGRGIDAPDRERVFELFRRAGAQDKPGEGIGLANVRGLVRRLGGTIRLESEPGRGSTFTIALPAAWSEYERKAA